MIVNVKVYDRTSNLNFDNFVTAYQFWV